MSIGQERVAGKLLHSYREDIMSERRDSYQMCEYGSLRPGGAFCLHLLLTNILQVLLALYSHHSDLHFPLYWYPALHRVRF